MKDLKHLDDKTLIAETKRLVRIEREVLADILNHFREVERRRLFGKNPSIYEWAINELGYSRDEAYRRKTAMYLMRESPELEVKVAAGQINLTHLNLADSLFKSEKKAGREFDARAKASVFEAVSGQSVRQAEKIIKSFASVPAEDFVNLKVNAKTVAKMNRLRSLLAHQLGNATPDEVLNRALDIALAQIDPARPVQKPKTNSRAEIRRQVWRRDGGVCVTCKSAHAIQEDHIHPKSLGGAYSYENIRLLCRACNQRAAIEKLGLSKMDRHLSAAPRKFAVATLRLRA